MKSTGIVRRMDDLGRVVIPKEIRRAIHVHEGDPFEIFIEGKTICFKKYEVAEEKFAQRCADWVQEHRKDIISIAFVDDTTYVVFMYNAKVKKISVKFNSQDKFDMNVAICYAAKKCGFQMFDGFWD